LNGKLSNFKASLSCVSYCSSQHSEIKVKETDVLAQLKTLNIKAQSGDWFVFQPDKGRGKSAIMSPLLAIGAHDHHKACDAVIVVLDGNRLVLLFIELKSSAPKGFIAQFRSSRQFTKYTLGLLGEFHNESFEEVQERFFVFHTPPRKKLSIAKTRTKLTSNPSQPTKPDEPQRILIQDGATIYLKELLK
jgi:hypothetical protein